MRLSLDFDRELTPEETRAITDAALAEFALLEMERESEPRRVHLTAIAGRASADICPDCTRGVSSRGEHGLICARLPMRTRLVACHPQCLVACGGVR